MSRIDNKEVKRVFEEFADKVVGLAKLNLKPSKLKESIRSEVDLSKAGSLSVYFFMNEYGLFQDRGVSGRRVKYLTKFTYKDKQPPSTPIANWAQKNFIRLRDEDGKFIKGSYDSVGFVIARSIKEKGIKPSLFFTKPFERLFNQLPDEIIEAYGLEIDKAIDNWLIRPNYTGANPNVL